MVAVLKQLPATDGERLAGACGDVLVIEDDEDIREIVRLTLEEEGYRVRTAPNGLEGLRLLEEHGPPCVLLLDLMMPVMNGWEVLEKLQEHEELASIPVVVVSASAARSPRAHVTHVLQKPVCLTLLLATVGRYCGHAHGPR